MKPAISCCSQMMFVWCAQVSLMKPEPVFFEESCKIFLQYFIEGSYWEHKNLKEINCFDFVDFH